MEVKLHLIMLTKTNFQSERVFSKFIFSLEVWESLD